MQELETTYRAAVNHLADGHTPAGTVVHTLLSSPARQALESSTLQEIHASGFRRYADRLLADDVISEEEDREFSMTSDALGVSDADLQTTFRDILFRLVIARANEGKLPAIKEAQFLAKDGEVVHLEMSASLLKQVTLREYQGQYSGMSFRVMKGVRYHTGGSRGHNVVIGTELQIADTGFLAVTSERVAFVGNTQTVSMSLKKLIGMQVYNNGVRFNVENRKTAPLFKIESGDTVAAVVNAALQRKT